MNSIDTESAKKYFEGDYNCSQSVLMALSKMSGLDIKQAEALTSGFGGGIGGHQEICGAVSGACLAIGYAEFNKHTDPLTGKQKASDLVKKFMDSFKAEMTFVRCSDLTGCNFSNETEKERFVEDGLKEKICFPAVELAVKLASDLI